MASVSISDEDLLDVLLNDCPNRYGWAKRPQSCFPHKPCENCDNGKVLSYVGQKIARLIQRYKEDE